MALFTPTNQIRYTNVAVVRHKIKGKKFEVACYRNKIVGWRSGIEQNIDDVIQSCEVFKDVATGSIATRKELLDVYGTDDVNTVIRRILTDGTYNMSDKEREEALGSMLKQIASQITTLVVSPQNNPYPQSIIEKALKEVHFKVNPNQSILKQTREAISKIKTVLPIVEFKMIIKIEVENTSLGNNLLKECTQYFDEVISEDIIQDSKKLSIKMKPQDFHKFELVLKKPGFIGVKKNIVIDKYHNIDRVT